MNKYIFVLIVCAVVFLICFLIDTLFKVIFPKSKLEKSKQVVRPPRKSAVAGVILTFAGVAVLIKNLAGTPDTLFLIGSIVAIIFGVILLCTYFSVVIYFFNVNAPYQVPYKLKAASAALLYCFFGFLTTSGNFSDHGSRSSKNDRSLSSMCLGISVRRCSKYSYGFRLFAFAVSAML